ncbi:MAG TPA: NAD(P)H-dependent oxidoreductase subunit E [Isosphaeraceae bacterium]|jgi:formate dehydrogenase
MPDPAQKPRPHIHPGSGRRRAAPHPKGRGVDPTASAEIRALLGDCPRRRDLLIEHLHLIQDRYGCLGAAHLAALADEMRLALAEVYEVATFYAHFDVVKEGDTPPPPRTVRVCDSVSCFLHGADRLLDDLADRLGAGVRVARAPCVGRCDRAPVAFVGHHAIDRGTADAVAQAVAEDRVDPVIPAYMGFEEYVGGGGYRALAECRGGRFPPEELIARVEASGLRGLGGAGFRSGQKWRLVQQQSGPRLLAINADEGEPGTFKDRHYLETDPHRFLEGMLVAAWSVEAQAAYIYLRDEYPHIRAILLREIDRLEAEGIVAPGHIHLRRGAGAYICGEETAMLESIEGKRGYPRHKPPFPTQVGLFGRPTLIHNVETVYWVRDILERGPEWLAGQGRNRRQGLRSFSVSGRVKQPGVKLAPAGITVRELIDEYCGGMQEGHAFKAYLPGGASGGILPAHLGDVPLDFGTLEPYGCFIGSAAVVVLSDRDNLRDVALNLMRFFEDESCGQCTPCRVGTEKAVKLMEQPGWDEPLLTELSAAMRDASICGLGQAAPNPLLSVLRYFPEDLR